MKSRLKLLDVVVPGAGMNFGSPVPALSPGLWVTVPPALGFLISRELLNLGQLPGRRLIITNLTMLVQLLA